MAALRIVNGSLLAHNFTASEVLIEDGRIVSEFSSGVDVATYDAEGNLLVPGLIDLHTHVFTGCSDLAVHADKTCLHRGVTTVADAGSTGVCDFQAFKKVAEKAKCSIYCFLHVSREGLTVAGCADPGMHGECDDLNQLDVNAAINLIRLYPAMIKGIKVRLSIHTTNGGKNEKSAFEKALECRDATGLPLMVHHAISSLSVDDVLNKLNSGDIYTHCYHGQQPNIIADSGKNLLQSVHHARERGVLFCVGHGRGSFSWKVAKVAAANQFWPDIVSSDLHSGNVDGPVFDLCNVMTKMLYLGMPLKDVLKATTENPAKVLGVAGAFAVGDGADVTVLRVTDRRRSLQDSEGVVKVTSRYLQPVAVWKKGVRYEIQDGKDLTG